MKRVISTSNSVSSSLRLKIEDVLIKKHKKGHDLQNIDIVAITEWIENKNGVDLFNLLRAFALVCNIVDGLEDLFFTIAKELPKKLDIKDLTIEDIKENLEESDEKIIAPYDYIKSIQKIIKETVDTNSFVETFENTILDDSLDILKSKFKIISISEYEKLKEGTVDNENKNNSISDSDGFMDYANNIEFTRTILRKDYIDEN